MPVTTLLVSRMRCFPLNEDTKQGTTDSCFSIPCGPARSKLGGFIKGLIPNWKWVTASSLFSLTKHIQLTCLRVWGLLQTSSYSAPRPPSFGPLHLSTFTWNPPKNVRFFKSRPKRRRPTEDFCAWPVWGLPTLVVYCSTCLFLDVLSQECLFLSGETLASASRSGALLLDKFHCNVVMLIHRVFPFNTLFFRK